MSPFGANSSLTMPAGPASCSAQTIQQAKNTSAIASVRFRSALAPRNSGCCDDEAVRGRVAPPDRADAGHEADPVGGEDEDEDRAEEPERPLDEVTADDALEQPVEAFDEPLEQSSARRPAPRSSSASRRCAKTISASATIQVTTIEFVIGKPNGRREFDGLLRQSVRHRLGELRDGHVSPAGASSTAHAKQGPIACRARRAGITLAKGAPAPRADRRGLSTPPACRACSAVPEGSSGGPWRRGRGSARQATHSRV